MDERNLYAAGCCFYGGCILFAYGSGARFHHGRDRVDIVRCSIIRSIGIIGMAAYFVSISLTIAFDGMNAGNTSGIASGVASVWMELVRQN